MNIKVTKRSGKIVELNLEKWQAQVAKVCEGVSDVSHSPQRISASDPVISTTLGSVPHLSMLSEQSLGPPQQQLFTAPLEDLQRSVQWAGPTNTVGAGGLDNKVTAQ